MKISDLTQGQIVVGMKIRSLTDPNKTGTIVAIDPKDDYYSWVQWDGEDKPYGGFYGNDCKCEVV